MWVNGNEEMCARCGGLIGPDHARGYVRGRRGRGKRWLCFACARPAAVRAFWLYDRAAAARRREDRRGLPS